MDNNTFGKFLKGNVYWAASDFRFNLVAKVICSVDSENTGYIINVYPETQGEDVTVM